MVYFGSYEGRNARNKTQLRFFFNLFHSPYMTKLPSEWGCNTTSEPIILCFLK